MAPKLVLPERILVVGGCGFLGHHIVQQLVAAGVKKVSVLDLRTERNRVANVAYHAADITAAAAVDAVLAAEQPQALIHTASPLAIDATPNRVYDKVNVQGTDTLLAAAGRAGCVQAFVYTSSASVIHNYRDHLRWADETWPVLHYPATPEYYSHTKGVAEEHVLQANRQHGAMLTAAIRPAGIFGEGDVQLIPPMVEAYLAGKTGFQVGDNTNLWDYTYVGNIAHAHLLAVQALARTGELRVRPLDFERVDGEAFIITNDEPVPFWDYARTVWTYAGWQHGDRRPWVIPGWLGWYLANAVYWLVWLATFGRRRTTSFYKGLVFSTQNRTFNIDKAKDRLGYRPLVSLDEGLKRGVKAHMKQLAAEEAKKKQ